MQASEREDFNGQITADVLRGVSPYIYIFFKYFLLLLMLGRGWWLADLRSARHADNRRSSRIPRLPPILLANARILQQQLLFDPPPGPAESPSLYYYLMPPSPLVNSLWCGYILSWCTRSKMLLFFYPKLRDARCACIAAAIAVAGRRQFRILSTSFAKT